ncbi:zinc-ribbon domain-containing protein [Lachnospiraceae bacterium XBD2001]|nr:zinc-ribbon domain-containing protein [Lachnospiraceae bacterium XBD2001]
MFCSNCGTKNNDDAVFCVACGTKLIQVNPAAQQPSTPNIPANEAKPTEKAKMVINKKLIIALVAIWAVLITALVIGYKLTHTIHLDKYLSVEFNGYDGYGKANGTFDYESFVKDYSGKLKLKDSSIEGYGIIRPEFLVTDAISGNFDTATELSNDDEVTWKWDVNTKVLNACNYKFKYKDKTYKVSDLEVVPKDDPFEYISVDFYGASPSGTATVTIKDGSKYEFQPSWFNIDKSSELKEGDTVTVTLGISVEECIEYFNFCPSQTSKEYTVSGLATYLESVDMISEEDMQALIQQGQDAAFSSMPAEDNSLHKCTPKTSTYVGNYFAISKFHDGDLHNAIYMVYKNTLDYTYQKSTTQLTYYQVVRFDNLLKDSDGVVNIDTSNYKKMSNTFEPNCPGHYWIHLNGFPTIADFESLVVSPNVENYTYTKNLTEE